MSTIDKLCQELGQKLIGRGYCVTTAESCTGGGIAQAITDIAGSSQWFSHGFVTYSNQAKQQLLAVPESLFLEHGAVSQAVAEAMVEGAINTANADLGVAVSGVAGPGGGSQEKPVGTVWIAWKLKNNPVKSRCYLFSGNRKNIRNQSVTESLTALIQAL